MKTKFCAKTDFGTVNRRYGNSGEIAVESERTGVAVTAFATGLDRFIQYNVYLTSGVERRGANAKLLMILTLDALTGEVVNKEST